MSVFHSVVKAEQCNSVPDQKSPLEENENPANMSNKELSMDQTTKIWKGVEGQTIVVGVKTRPD